MKFKRALRATVLALAVLCSAISAHGQGGGANQNNFPGTGTGTGGISNCTTPGGLLYQNGTNNQAKCTANLVWDPVNGILKIFQQTNTNGCNVELLNSNDANPLDFMCVNQNGVNGFALGQNNSTTANVTGDFGVNADGSTGMETINNMSLLFAEWFTTAGLGAGFNEAIGGVEYTFNMPAVAPVAGQDLQTPGGTTQTLTWATRGVQCGTIAANGACANTLTTSEHCISGVATLSAGTSTITGISPTFTSSSSYIVLTSDTTTPANANHGTAASGSSITFTGTGTDSIQFIACGG